MEQLKLFVIELLKYHNRGDMVDELSKWKCPMPPINGKFLKDLSCPEGKVMGRVRQLLVEKWIDSRFTLTQDDLRGLYPMVIESLKGFIEEEANKRSSGKRKLSSSAKN